MLRSLKSRESFIVGWSRDIMIEPKLGKLYQIVETVTQQLTELQSPWDRFSEAEHVFKDTDRLPGRSNPKKKSVGEFQVFLKGVYSKD